jgi:uncharacterized protein (DUF2147 family)
MIIKRCLTAILTLFFSTQLFAASPVGVWIATDDHDVAISMTQTYVAGGKLNARIVKLLSPHSNQKEICVACKGENKNKPLVGLTYIWGLTSKDGKWINGHLLDINTGKTYNCDISVSDDNRTLHVRVYVGTALFGRTVNWARSR